MTQGNLLPPQQPLKPRDWATSAEVHETPESKGDPGEIGQMRDTEEGLDAFGLSAVPVSSVALPHHILCDAVTVIGVGMKYAQSRHE